MSVNAMELYCGIGGFAQACENLNILVKEAYNQNDFAIETYNANFVHSGAYLICKEEPKEIASLLGFGDDFVFPEHLIKRQCYKLVGNSISVFALKSILT